MDLKEFLKIIVFLYNYRNYHITNMPVCFRIQVFKRKRRGNDCRRGVFLDFIYNNSFLSSCAI